MIHAPCLQPDEVVETWLLTIQHELHDGIDRLILGAHPQQFDNVLMFEPLHDLCLTQEIQLLLHCGANLQRLHCYSHLKHRFLSDAKGLSFQYWSIDSRLKLTQPLSSKRASPPYTMPNAPSPSLRLITTRSREISHLSRLLIFCAANRSIPSDIM